MKNKILATVGAAVISVGVIGGVAFASDINDNGFKENQQVAVKENSISTSQASVESGDSKTKNTVKKISTNGNTNYNKNSANNPAKDTYQDMVKIMRDNGFKDAARYMQTRNYDAMANYMNNLSQENYDKMIEIMNNNGYGYMGQMMKSIGREGMIQMHNSMRSIQGSNVNSGNYNNMMGGF